MPTDQPEDSPAVLAVRKWLVDVQVSHTTPEPEVGSDAWFLRRKELWDQNTHDLMAALVRYEDEHPADAICLAPVLAAAARAARAAQAAAYEAAKAVARAIRDSGTHPEYHAAVMQRHRQEWPALWRALDRLLTAVDDA